MSIALEMAVLDLKKRVAQLEQQVLELQTRPENAPRETVSPAKQQNNRKG